MTKNIQALLLIILFVFSHESISGEPVRSVTNNALNYADSTIESWAQSKFKNLRLIELDTNLRHDRTTDFRVLTMFELSGNDNKKSLSQISFSSYDDRETLNLGLVWRNINNAQTLIYGYNLFYDTEINTGHSRLGFGLELKSSVYDVNLNFYEALSNKHDVNGAKEEAADGYDLEVAMYLPYLPWAKVYYKGYEWDSSVYDVKHGESLSMHLQPTSRIALEFGRQRDNTMSTGLSFIKIGLYYLL